MPPWVFAGLHSSVNGALLGLAREAGRDRGRKRVRFGSAGEMLEYGYRNGYMLYETTFSERKRVP